MGRREYQHLVLKCNKGINQQRDLASLEECAEALNVWAPNGAIEQRPGFTGVTSMPVSSTSITSQSQVFIKYDGSSYTVATEGQTLSLNSLAANRYWYIGFDEIEDLYTDNSLKKVMGIGVQLTATNSNSVDYKAEYYSTQDSDWKYLRVNEKTAFGGDDAGNHLANALSVFHFVSPADWGTTTVSSQTKYFIRFTLLDALDSTVTINNVSGTAWVATQRDGGGIKDPTRGLFAAQFPTTKRYIYFTTKNYAEIHSGETLTLSAISSSGSLGAPHEDGRGSIAVVPQYGEAFVSTGDKVGRLHVNTGSSEAKVESRDFAVGPNAPYDPELVIQLKEFPEARFISFFKGRLWCSGIKGLPYEVRWTAAAPFHTVWPVLSAEPLMEDDNSPITGMSPYGEHMVVFKSDSVWQMMNTGPNSATLVEHYSPIKVVSGVGCVSNSSVQQVRGNLLFLGEDGVYAFDGTPNIKKMSDRITDTINSITAGRRDIACSAHWKTKSLYLLSVAVDGSFYNNKTLVYDYKNDAWWEWDIPAQYWLVDEDGFDNEALYFMDSYQSVFRMDDSGHDYGAAIPSHIVSQRLGENTNARRTLRQIEVLGNNTMGTVSVEAIANDDNDGADTGSIIMTDSSEAVYGTAVSGTDKYVKKRRRARRIAFRKQADWFQVKVSNSAYNTPMTIAGIDVAFAGELKR
mgnify:FL=1